MATQARGLHNFISDIRNASTKEAELKRVEKELANIRQKFNSPEKLNSYHKKKYVWKLVYIFVLGYEVDFGHMEAISLMTSSKFSEKNVGYVAIALMVNHEKDGGEMMTLVVNSIKNDLLSANDGAQALALACIANMGGSDLAGALAGDVQRLLVGPDTHPAVKKKAALTLLRLFRTNPECMVHNEWADRLSALLTQPHLGVLTSSLSLLLGLASRSPADYEGLVPYIITNMHRLVINRANCRMDYLYYNTPSPWLQVKLLKFLQYFPAPTDPTQVERLNEVLQKIITKTDASESVNKSNADHAVLFESVNLIVHQGQESDSKLRHQALTLLGRFISVREPNIRYIGLQTMARLAQLEGNEAIKKHEQTVLVSLKDADISVRRRALDLLFVMCDTDNSVGIVEELVDYLAAADVAIKEEMVLKIAIVAEKYAVDLTWYLETILTLITLAGDFISDDIWHRMVQIVTNNKDLQPVAAEKLFVALESTRAHEATIKVGAYVLGEFGYLIAEDAGRSGEDQFQLLMSHFTTSSVTTQYQMMTTFMKLANLYEECRPLAAPVFEKYRTAAELEVQQRANEYSVLPSLGDEMMEDVLREMPAYATDKKSALEQRLLDQQNATHDGNAWVMDKDNLPSQSTEGAGDEADEGEYPPVAAGGAAPEPNLLDMDGPPAATPAAPAEKAAPAAAAAGGEIGITQEQIPLMKGWFNALVIGPQGVLFENQDVQVGCRHQYQGSQARISLFIKNKQTVPVTGLSVDMPEVSYLRVQTQPTAPNLEPGASSEHKIAAEAMAPYEGAPEFAIAFQAGGASHRYTLRLPTVASCFIQAVPSSADEFKTRWKALEGQNREQQVVWNTSTSIDSERMQRIKTAILDQGLHLAIIEGVDQNEYILSAAGQFRTGTVSPSGAKVSVGCLLRLEANAQQSAFRLTVRAVHGMISVALKNIVKSQVN